MKLTKNFITQFQRHLDPTRCQRCHEVPIAGVLYCSNCRDEIDMITIARDSLQLDDDLPDGMHIVTRRGLALQNKGK